MALCIRCKRHLAPKICESLIIHRKHGLIGFVGIFSVCSLLFVEFFLMLGSKLLEIVKELFWNRLFHDFALLGLV
jgi:hypothetical protein